MPEAAAAIARSSQEVGDGRLRDTVLMRELDVSVFLMHSQAIAALAPKSLA